MFLDTKVKFQVWFNALIIDVNQDIGKIVLQYEDDEKFEEICLTDIDQDIK